MALEDNFDAAFVTGLALREKQIQQNYRPVIGVHKWFARRPGSVFRSLLLAEFNCQEPLCESYWNSHEYKGVIADPFMGGGTPVIEANRLGFHVVGTDINPMAFWIVRQSLGTLDQIEFRRIADEVIEDVEREIGEYYRTICRSCDHDAEIKYFFWVKISHCPQCKAENKLFPGFRLAESVRHPRHVLACSSCGDLTEFDDVPTKNSPGECGSCGGQVHMEGFARRHETICQQCGCQFPYLSGMASPPEHHLWGIEYHCIRCKPNNKGRFFKAPDAKDLKTFDVSTHRLKRRISELPIPQEEIPRGDETDRLHRWGYFRYREMFNSRQLLGLGTLLNRIAEVRNPSFRHALLTVFSDFLRYQNMLCRYDTYALKCQDIFSVHGFPVALVQCENNLLGIPKVGSGSYRHFIEKYLRAKEYCERPFETRRSGSKNVKIKITGEQIAAKFVDSFPEGTEPQAWISALAAGKIRLPPRSLDGVFTDPPYFDNVQYSELMDFCFVWLRTALAREFSEFQRTSTRASDELIGNKTTGRGLEEFTAGMSEIFTNYSLALKPDAPFVFTYHHNKIETYCPLVIAILDADLVCCATLPAAGEMSASLHIAGTSSSVLDTVFVCRHKTTALKNKLAGDNDLPLLMSAELSESLFRDAVAMRSAGVSLSRGDLRCISIGHIARISIGLLTPNWVKSMTVAKKLEHVEALLHHLMAQADLPSVIGRIISNETVAGSV